MRNSRSARVRLFGAVIVATLSWGRSTPPAVAGTFQCDNDRAAGQYPNCTTPRPAGWTYRSGQRSDANGDDRLGTSSSTSYRWLFTGIPGDRLSLAAWLANTAFTEPRAEYGVGTDVANVINQNTAPNGWNQIGQGIFGGNQPTILLIASVPDNARIGADLVQITTIAGVIKDDLDAGRIDEPALCGAAAIEDSALVALQHRMLNAVDNFRDVQGSYHIMFANNGQDERIEFEASEQVPGSYVRITSAAGEVSEHAFDGRALVRLDAARETFRVSGVAPASSLNGTRQFFTAACEPVYVQRRDPAAAHAANDVTLPQNYAFWLSDSEAHIVGSASLVGRAATVVEGRHTAYLQDKLGATTFTMWVDDQTGVLLQLIGSDAKGGVVYQVAVEDIQFDRGVDRSHFRLVVPGGFTSTSAPVAAR